MKFSISFQKLIEKHKKVRKNIIKGLKFDFSKIKSLLVIRC